LVHNRLVHVVMALAPIRCLPSGETFPSPGHSSPEHSSLSLEEWTGGGLAPPAHDLIEMSYSRHPFRVCLMCPAPPVDTHAPFQLPCWNDTLGFGSKAEGSWVQALPAPTGGTLIRV